jgi:hypothetical protein
MRPKDGNAQGIFTVPSVYGLSYLMRARTVEPVFGQLKTCQKLTMMSRRGLAACENEWLLACASAQSAQAAPAPRGGLTVKDAPPAAKTQDRSLAPISAFQDPSALPAAQLCATG